MSDGIGGTDGVVMTEPERIARINMLRTDFHRSFARVSEIMAELNALGCEAWIQCDEQGDQNVISLQSKIVAAPSKAVH